MQKLKKIYRDSYGGENVVTSMTYENSDWTTVTEYVPNAVFNTHTTTQAIAIGNGESRTGFDLRHVANHRAGIGGANRLQSYGCNALYRDFTPDFLVAVGAEIAKEIAVNTYPIDNIVYAHGEHVIEYPGKFYLIPQNVSYDAGSLAVYLACFDGHKKVFMLGYDGYDVLSNINNVYKDTNGYPSSTEHQNSDFLTKTLVSVMTTYDDVEFVRIMPESSHWIPDALDALPNFRQINFREFVLEADIG
jgi:hypothetical protein